MKAAARQCSRVTAAICFVSICIVSPGYGASSPSPPPLPFDVPALPRLGEDMLRHIPSGLALRGFDPVAYHLGKGPVAGVSAFEVLYGGQVWRFASAANRDAFGEAPAIYQPRFDALDASAVAEGRAVDADPQLYAVVDDRLYFFQNDENRRRFIADAGLRRDAEAKWAEVKRLIAR